MSAADEKEPPGRDPFVQESGDVATEEEHKVERPRRYRVLLHNDDYTTMEFVVMVLMDIFHHSERKAVEIMLHVHQQGVGLAGIYPREVAETKVTKVTELARQQQFPLRSSMEPE